MEMILTKGFETEGSKMSRAIFSKGTNRKEAMRVAKVGNSIGGVVFQLDSLD